MQYATAAQFTEIYSLRDISSAQITAFLVKASVKLTELLAPYYDVPFSSTNASARDLTIDFALLNFQTRTKDQRDSRETLGDVSYRLRSLMKCEAQMVYDDGSVVPRSGVSSSMWSTTQDYKSVFDLRGAELQRIDPDQLEHFLDLDLQ